MINFIIIILLSLDYISFLIFLCFSISRNIHLLLYYNGYCIIIIIYSYCYHKLQLYLRNYILF